MTAEELAALRAELTEELKVSYSSQAAVLRSNEILTEQHLQNIDSALDSAAGAEQVAHKIAELTQELSDTEEELDSKIEEVSTELAGQIEDLSQSTTAQFEQSALELEEVASEISDQLREKANVSTSIEANKNKYWKFDENGILVFAELQIDDKLDVNQGVANKKKYLKVNDLGYVEATDLDLIVTSLLFLSLFNPIDTKSFVGLVV